MGKDSSFSFADGLVRIYTIGGANSCADVLHHWLLQHVEAEFGPCGNYMRARLLKQRAACSLFLTSVVATPASSSAR